MKTIKLYGDLQRFKPQWSLDVKTVSEAMRAIEANRPGFIDFADQGAYVLVLVDIDNPDNTRQVTGSNAVAAWATEELWVIPKPQGELGAAIAGAIGLVGVWATVVAIVIDIAIAIAISYIAQMITSTNSGMSAQETEPYDSKPSYLMNGTINTRRQGHPIPLLYGGPLLIGSMELSVDIHTQDIPA